MWTRLIRLDLVMTDISDIVDVVVGTPLDTSDHCFIIFHLNIIFIEKHFY